MKSNSLITLIAAIFLLTNCGDNKAATNEKQETNTSSSEKKEGSSSSSPEQGDDIIGEWELAGFIVDTNDNLIIDEEERKNLKPPSYKDYMKLNKDGTGLFTIAKLEGRYEIKDDAKEGKKYFAWYDRSNSEHRIGTIRSVTRNELQIKESGGNGLFLWKRI